jgi:hypothetical protein
VDDEDSSSPYLPFGSFHWPVRIWVVFQSLWRAYTPKLVTEARIPYRSDRTFLVGSRLLVPVSNMFPF